MEVVANEHAVLVARRNTLMSELLRIAPSVNPPSPETARQPSNHAPVKKIKREVVVPMQKQKPVTHEIKNKIIIKQTVKEEGDAFADNPQLKMVNGVHLDIYDYFCTNPEKTTKEQLDRLGFIYTWVLKHGKTLREGLLKLNNLDNKLGSAEAGEAKIIKIYNYLRLRYGNT